jgi:energy-coupling factor transporter ATP-binding protein EcfA2
MPFEPIRQLDIENYGCIQKASFVLTPLHALIGPNDSGKSTTLRALRTIARCATEDEPGRVVAQKFEMMWGRTSKMAAVYSDGLEYRAQADDKDPGKLQIAYRQGAHSWRFERLWEGHHFSREASPSPQMLELAGRAWGRLLNTTMVRFDPNALRKPAGQILSNQPVRFGDETGLGLASVYQAINSRDVDAFVAIRDRVRSLFPTIQNILVPTIGVDNKGGNQVGLQARLIDGTIVPVEALSEGLLYFLGFMALQQTAESRLFLVEEPENGLHPARVAEVMGILREISKTSQVVIATHSPLVVNELKGDEVSVVTRDPATGTQVKLLKDVPGFDDGAKVYLPGEFWVSYADGNMEKPLLTGSARP